ncbi:LysR family transcriptional regulator [Halomonas stenophila]|uniref:DNA-binding transcriptional LysR family regulator n=1 Tax=Halomonas stenophila TaxID=795312 RepID=A0A7W5ESB2_9GAMM|nr:LysR family transcriptional regulator [Halomonas stenophila]MBB3230137.1 DNA-binding transcriptional LysR family regulator [Halomonas stenophila]
MDRFTAMQVFVAVTERGSVTAAADALDMSRAMASRYLESLERWLGARLLHRTTRRIALTDAGHEALSRCRQMLDLADEVQTAAGVRSVEPRGRLRIATSQSFAQAWLAEAVAEFLAGHPQAQVELLVLERAVNLVEERVDLAVRITNQLDESLVARRLCSCRSVLCASPGYVERNGVPQTPEELAGHTCVTHAYVSRSEIRLYREGRSVTAPVRGRLSSNETGVVRVAALAGAGVAMLPTYFVADDLRQGRLVPVVPTWEPEPLAIHAVYLSRRYQPLLLRAMIDFLVERLGGDVAPWDCDIDTDGAT